MGKIHFAITWNLPGIWDYFNDVLKWNKPTSVYYFGVKLRHEGGSIRPIACGMMDRYEDDATRDASEVTCQECRDILIAVEFYNNE